MQHRRLKDGTHVVGFWFNKAFVVYANAFDEREGRALVKAIRSVFDLYHATSGAFCTMRGTTKIPRAASAKAAKKEKGKKKKNGGPN